MPVDPLQRRPIIGVLLEAATVDERAGRAPCPARAAKTETPSPNAGAPSLPALRTARPEPATPVSNRAGFARAGPARPATCASLALLTSVARRARTRDADTAERGPEARTSRFQVGQVRPNNPSTAIDSSTNHPPRHVLGRTGVAGVPWRHAGDAAGTAPEAARRATRCPPTAAGTAAGRHGPSRTGARLSGKTAFPIESPVAKAQASAGRGAAHRPQAEEAIQIGRIAPDPLHPAQDGGRAGAIIGPLPVGEVGLVVVVVEEAIVDRLQLRPGGGSRGVVVSHPPHDVEVGLDSVLPRLALVDFLLADAEGDIDRFGVVRLEHPATVADHHLRRPVGLDRRPQHDEVGGQVLARGNGARQQPRLKFSRMEMT